MNEDFTVTLGDKDSAKLFIDTMIKVFESEFGKIVVREGIWKYVRAKKHRSRKETHTTYSFVYHEDMLFGVDSERLLDSVFVTVIKETDDFDMPVYCADLDRDKSHICIKSSCDVGYGLLIKIITQIESRGEKSDNAITLLYNFARDCWEKTDRVGNAFLKNYNITGGYIDIDCKQQDPIKVKNLFIRAITMLYARCGAVRYGGTSSKRDDYMRDTVEKDICKPEVKGNRMFCSIWNTFNGPSWLVDEYNDDENYGPGCYDGYHEDPKITYDHAFRIFLSKSGDVDFISRVCIAGHCSEDEIDIFYSENGKIVKVNMEDWVKPYLRK